MRLEVIAVLLGHQKNGYDPDLRQDRQWGVVADEYAPVSAKVDALYGQPELPDDYETTRYYSPGL